MVLGSAQPLREMSTKNIFRGVKTAGALDLPPSCVLKFGSPNFVEPSRPVMGFFHLLNSFKIKILNIF